MTDANQGVSTQPAVRENWAPGTDELEGALPDLLAGMRADGVLIRRVMYNPADWSSPTPRRVRIDDEVIRLGAFNYQERGTITLVADDGRSRTTVHRAST